MLHGQLLDILRGLNSSSRSSSTLSGANNDNGGADRNGDDREEDDEWTYYGLGRDDGHQAGEYSPILYRPSSWKLKSARTIWLSPTPEVAGSKGWDAASVRICGLVVLEEQQQQNGVGAGVRRKRRLLLMNTHLDDQGRRSRIEGAKIILCQLEHCVMMCDEGENGGIDAVVLAGDLNSEAPSPASTSASASETRGRGAGPAAEQKKEKEDDNDDEEEDAYTILNAPGSALRDIRPSVPAQRRYGHEWTFTGFDGRGDGEGRCKRIDFVHVGVCTASGDQAPTGGDDGEEKKEEEEGEEEGKGEQRCAWRVEGYAVLPNVFDDGVYISDHRAVVAEIEVPPFSFPRLEFII